MISEGTQSARRINRYIQVSTNLQFAKVVRADGQEKIAFGSAEDCQHTMYLSPERAKALAFRLLEAANHAGKQ